MAISMGKIWENDDNPLELVVPIFQEIHMNPPFTVTKVAVNVVRSGTLELANHWHRVRIGVAVSQGQDEAHLK